MECPRYLLPFDTNALPAEAVEVLVIGAGVAGLSCAIESASQGRQVLLLSKGGLADSNTNAAQGGIAAALHDFAESADAHFSDTMATGEGLSDEHVVREIVDLGQEAIDFLINAGCVFDRDAKGRLDAATEAAHTEARVLHAGGDKTGHEIARSLISRAEGEESIRAYEDCFVVDLLTEGDRAIGALVLFKGELRVIYASVVVLASGGCGRLYRESSNPKVATGDGHAMALRAGAIMRDLELIQFHPTILYVAGAPRVLVTEAIRGAGAYLRNEGGERFMLRVDERAELAPRDVVSRAIEEEMREREEVAVFLDVTHLPIADIRRRFPGFTEVCESRGLDLEKSWVPVRPGPHYMIGGLRVDHQGRSSIDGLYAIGEAASSGLHGANRLASNSLLEGVVLGRKLGAHLSGLKLSAPLASRVRWDHRAEIAALEYEDLRNAFHTQMMRAMGVVRDAEGMQKMLGRIENWIALVDAAAPREQSELECANMLHLGRAMARSALAREESRGVHSRRDFPERRDDRDGDHVNYSERSGANWDG